MNEPTISESVSGKRKRGRPRTWIRESADQYGRMFGGSNCERTNTNEAYRLRAVRIAFDLPDEEQRVLFGFTKAEAWNGKAGTGRFPPGWKTAAEEIGRFLVSLAGNKSAETEWLRVAIEARRNGIPWRDIRSHFRAIRLGKRQGNAISLTTELARTIDGYRSRFQATTDQQMIGAVESLLEVLSERIGDETGSLG
jgi:hypothetical protein